MDFSTVTMVNTLTNDSKYNQTLHIVRDFLVPFNLHTAKKYWLFHR